MTTEQQQVKDMMLTFNQECPETPTIPDLETRKLRAKLILEEALETIKGLGVDIHCYRFDNNSHLRPEVHIDDFCYLGSVTEPILKDILDGCEDLKVVTEGTLLACGLIDRGQKTYYDGSHGGGFEKGINQEDKHFNEVMRSNMSKMWTYQEIADLPDYHEYVCMEVSPHRQSERSHRGWIVKDKDGKFIKSPSYSPPNFKLD